ncbi:MAG: TonB C-terminal domain-containing protein [Acidobacteriota bacterium]
MARDRQHRYGQEKITLRQALIIALLLHLILAGVAEWRPDLLYSEPVIPVGEQQPLQFRFVDIPEAEPPPQPPETEMLSDRDRQARDLSPRDDAEDPFSEGDTSQEVLRSTPASQPGAVPAQTMPVEPTPPREAVEAETPPPDEEKGVLTAVGAPRPEEAPATEATPPIATGPPVALPPEEPKLNDSLGRLESFIRPERYDNPDGGADGPQGLVSFDTKGYDLGAYIRQVLQIIERNWKANIPPAARMPGMKGATFVRMSIERVRVDGGGEAARVVVHRTWSSGKPAFDQAAEFALQISNPLPPIPSYFPYQKLDGRLGFLYNLDPSQVIFPSER